MAPQFLEPLDVAPTGKVAATSGLPVVRLRSPFTFLLAPGVFIQVPAGYTSDYASLPSIIRWAWRPDDPHWAQAAVLHDYMCREFTTYSRHFADYAYLAGMLTLGANPRIAWMQYVCLKLRAVWLKLTAGRGYYLPTEV